MVQPQRTYSPFAQPALAGLGASNNSKVVDRPHVYVFPFNGITANSTVTGLFQLIDNDSDFFWRAFTTSSTNNAAFGLRFQDPNGYYLSDDFLSSSMISTQYLTSPFPLVPALFCPAGSKIVIDLQDNSGSTNNVLINFIGVKRYYVG